MDNRETPKRQRPTPLFMHYVLQLALRVVLFVVAVVLCVVDPQSLDIRGRFGLAHGIDFVDIVFLLMVMDLLTKFLPHAKIAMGSRKQYGTYHVPTALMFDGGPRELAEHARQLVRNLVGQGATTVGDVAAQTIRAAIETAEGMREAGRQFVYSIDIMRVLPWPEEDLTADERMRDDVRRRRIHEIVPVIIFWVTGNLAVWLLLERFGLFNEHTALIWTLFYFAFDMVCVVLWCPLQLALMRNRCCTTCQIFNWDGIMTVTPLLAVGGWFGWILIALSLVVLVRWELAFLRHPERFDERTNASLQCANCVDKLCYLRKPLTPRVR